MCQEGWVILIKILYLPVNQQSLPLTMVSVLLIDQKTFYKNTESDVTVPSAIKVECLWEQLFHWDHVYSSVVKDAVNLLPYSFVVCKWYYNWNN